jgi:DNA-binding SARP family transcriptional activator
MWLGVLGPTVVRAAADDPGRATALRAAKHRALLAALAVAPGRPMSADALVQAIWGDEAPPSAQATLHTYLSVVRRTLEPDLPARARSRYLVSSDLGYELRLEDGALDAAEFARCVSEVHAGLGPLAAEVAPWTDDADTAQQALGRLESALALWRGEPFADVTDTDQVVAERARLADLRLLALEDRATVLVASGAPESASADLESLTVRHPLRERPWTLLAVAQARSGRQADALATLERLRATLDEQLGIDPSPVVRDLQIAILRQEPAVSSRTRATSPARSSSASPVASAHPVAPRPTPDIPVVDLSEPAWPLVGREAHLNVLETLLAATDSGTPAFATLIGEPGAGKSRLALELCLRARDRGALVVVGRCSQDHDAPPLWPWTTALGEDLVPAPRSGVDHDAARFEVAETIRRRLRELAAGRTVVLVLEDLHWADPLSLRVLRHLCGQADTGRLLVVCTWRSGAPGGPLAEAAEALARRHAVRIDLEGLSAEDSGAVLRAVASDEVDEVVAMAARTRTDGNPFFLIEYARLARDEDRALADVLGEMPHPVSDVVRRRINQLPSSSADALTAGAVIGREFDLDLLAGELEQDEDDVLDLLEPALAVDLVQDLGGDRFRFGHALVRDTAYAALTPSRRERMHASLAALVEKTPRAAQRAPEIARHWAAAGPRHVGRAWRAAATAGHRAMDVHAAEEAPDHYRTALGLLEKDPDATRRDRWDLLVGYADACRWSTRLIEMMDSIDEAILIADELGDAELVVGAAAVATDGQVWQIRSYGCVHQPVVDAMRRALEQLPRDDTEVRCRLLLLLAGELFYSDRPAEVDALVEDSVAMARRLGDDRLLLSALTYGSSTRWRRAAIRVRREMALEAVELARRTGDERTGLLARFLLASVRAGLGDRDGVEGEVIQVSARAREQRMYFLELATLTQTQSWASMRGDVEQITANTARLFELDGLISIAQKTDALKGALLVPQIWGGPAAPVEVLTDYTDGANVPIEPAIVVMLLRSGEHEGARQLWAGHRYELGGDDWYRELHHAFGAEIALELGERDLGAELYERLRPLRGGCIISGTGPAHGPADAYLAMAAAAAGETALATEHAAAAAALCRTWDLPQVALRLDDLRERHGF